MHFTEFHTRIAAYVLIVDGDRILLSWYRGDALTPPCWTMPGGGVEFDETLRDAAVRELYEETGYHVKVGGILAEDHLTFAARDGRLPIRSQRFVFDGSIVGGTLGTTEVDGTTEYARWLPIAEVRSMDQAIKADIVDVALAYL
ncbi:hypothetical protein nbrc107696_13290 [Gordonia spumicola]|uniref:Nudix hydrolase domain-containing protein n=1 Tax=Gordonia spumicola TaxID=589161 RepID=A0A7I9V727_9ACTN|nr:NUDIX domain-containing protein [Gordonia spumicola]GEE00883.1 hypothetical protein nbrc107696_13290 [Gordonia spumicola]